MSNKEQTKFKNCRFQKNVNGNQFTKKYLNEKNLKKGVFDLV